MLYMWGYLPIEIVDIILAFLQERDPEMTCPYCELVGHHEWFLDGICLQCHDYIHGNGNDLEQE